MAFSIMLYMTKAKQKMTCSGGKVARSVEDRERIMQARHSSAEGIDIKGDSVYATSVKLQI